MSRIATLLAILSAWSLQAQSYTAEDSVEIQQALRATYFIEADNPEAALKRYDSLHAVSLEKGYLIGAGRGRMYKAIVLNDMGQYEEAIGLYEQALPYFYKAQFVAGIAGTHNNMGVSYNLQGQLDSAATHYLKAIYHYNQLGDTNMRIIMQGNAGGIFMELDRFDKAGNYFDEALELALLYGDSVRLADAYINKGYLAVRTSHFAEAETYYDKALQIGLEIENAYITYLAANNKSDLYYQNEQWQKALEYARLALQEARLNENPFHLVNALNNLGLRYVKINNPDSAVIVLKESIALATELGQQGLIADGHLYLAEAYAKLGNFAEAYQHSDKHRIFAEAMLKERQSEVVAELETKYQTERKDREIAEKSLGIAVAEAKAERQRIWLILVMGALIVLLVISLSYYRSSRHKAKLQEERMLRAEQEQAVEQLKARMDGEERERKRLARELHDGIGGQLAMIRAQLRNGNGQNEVALALQNTDAEVRRIAHNLMPEILVKHGLRKALEAFAEQCDGAPYPVDFEWLGNDAPLEVDTALVIYRSVQELVKNAIKHAEPQRIFVQVICNEETIYLTVEDDGKGMDDKAVEGMGLNNVRERLRTVGGALEMQSNNESGTSAVVNIPIKTLAI